MSRNRFIALSIAFDALLVNSGIRPGLHSSASTGQPAGLQLPRLRDIGAALTLLYLGGAWTYGLYEPERADTAWA